MNVSIRFLALCLLAALGVGCREKAPEKSKPSRSGSVEERGRLQQRIPLSAFAVHDISNVKERPSGFNPNLNALFEKAFGECTALMWRPSRRAVRGDFEGAALVLYMIVRDGQPAPDAVAGEFSAGVEAEISRHPEGAARQVFTVRHRTDFPMMTTEEKRQAWMQQRLASVISEAVRRLDLQVHIRQAQLEEVLGILGSDQPFDRREAIGEIARRRVKEGVMPIVGILKESDRDTRLRAIGALAELKDGRAVRPLVQLTVVADLDVTSAVVVALGEIGGDLAIRYLESFAESSPFLEVQRKARLALEIARKKERR